MAQVIHILFPMAGEGSRFGYCFKPLLKATEETFIELAAKPFEKLRLYGYEPHYVFIYRQAQEEQYKVSTKLATLFHNKEYQCILIDSSDGPLQTVQKAIGALEGPAFVCDCDHSIDIQPMIENLELHLSTVDAILPTWNIRPEEYFSWGKVKVNTSHEIIDFCEKETLPCSKNESLKGLIGCYCFSNIALLKNYPSYPDFSSVFKVMLKDRVKLMTVPINKADFFGTPKQLEAFRFSRTKQYTLFLDIDGVLIHQENKQLLFGTLEKIQQWKKEGHRIVLTTASPLSLCKKWISQIPHDHLITDLTPGPRILINDHKPYLPYYQMADGIILERNQGIHPLDLTSYEPPLIVSEFKGASFARIFLVEQKGREFVRKFIPKSAENTIHLESLKRQYEDLKRWKYICPSLTPTVERDFETHSHYYYDMEHLKGYETLSQHPDPYPQVEKLLQTLFKEVYAYQKPLERPTAWLEDYLQTKIFPKFDSLPSLSPSIEALIHHRGIYINSVFYPSLPELFNAIPLEKMAPIGTCPIHGDLTLENIMFHPETGDIKVIDHAGSRYMDAIELDLAKLFQSLICNYHQWKDYSFKVIVLSSNHYTIPEVFTQFKSKYNELQSILALYDPNVKGVFLKGLYYMSSYFVRMVPFMYAQSEDQALFILLLAHIHLTYVMDELPK